MMIDNRSPLPDIEAALIAWFKADPEVIAVVPRNKISTELPTPFVAENRIQLFRTTGGPVDAETEVIDRPVVQINSFGSSKGTAFDVAQVVTGSLKGAEGKIQGDVTFYLSERLTGPGWSPDPSTDVPRYLMTWGITCR